MTRSRDDLLAELDKAWGLPVGPTQTPATICRLPKERNAWRTDDLESAGSYGGEAMPDFSRVSPTIDLLH